MYPYEYNFSPGDDDWPFEGDFFDNGPYEFDFSPGDDDWSYESIEKDSPLILPRIQKEMNFSEKEISDFRIKLKVALNYKRDEYVIPVMQVRKAGDVQRCTNCNRRILSVSDHALEFKVAFYHFLFGRRIEKIYLRKLHNRICAQINLPKMTRKEYRSIKLYFDHFWNRGFEIIQEAHKYLLEHPEFENEIKSVIDKSKGSD